MAAEEELRRLENQWLRECGEGSFTNRRKELESDKVALEGLAALEQREWEELTARLREKRFAEHLRSFALLYARIPGLGLTTLGTLAARGVNTAADITPEGLMAVPGIDLALVKGLLLFKEVATRSFAFDPATGIPGKDRGELSDRQARRREMLEKTIQTGAGELAELRRRTLARREELADKLEGTHRRLAQLRAGAPLA